MTRRRGRGSRELSASLPALHDPEPSSSPVQPAPMRRPLPAGGGPDGTPAWHLRVSARSGARVPGGHPRETSARSEEHTSELQSQFHLVCRLLLEKKKKRKRES